MMERYGFGIVLAAVWGTGYALFLQTYPGRFLAARLTWLSVVIGIGVDLVIAAVAIGLETALLVGGLIALSAVPIVVRSFVNEMRDLRTLNHGHSHKSRE